MAQDQSIAPAEASMAVPVMDIRVMRVAVRDDGMPMAVAVVTVLSPPNFMLMLMVLVMTMPVFVFQYGMNVFMGMALS